MSDIKQIIVSVFDNYRSKISYETANLWDWLLSDRGYRSVVDMIRNTTDTAFRDDLKSRLPAVTISCVCRVRSVSQIIHNTRLICLDMDDIEDVEATKAIISQKPYVLYCGLSVGGKGLFAIVQISDPHLHLQHFLALEKDFADMVITIDPRCKEVTRLRGYSYDDHPYINLNAEIYTKTLVCDSSQTSHSRNTNRIYTDTNNMAMTGSRPIFYPAEELLKPSLRHGASAFPESIDFRIKRLISIIAERQQDITFMWDDWFYICKIMVKVFGEAGSAYFHEISRFYNKSEEKSYSYGECEKLFQYCLNRKAPCRPEDIFDIARNYGIESQ